MRRKRRPGEVICRCGAYGFPHRFMGGRCDGSAWVARFYDNELWGRCRGCVFRERLEAGECGRDYHQETCQVVEGREDTRECPELADHIRYEGVRLYGVNKPPPRRAGWRR